MYLTQNAMQSLSAATIYFVCLVGAILLTRILRSYEQPDSDRRRPPVWFVPVCLAFAGGCVLLIPGIDSIVPETWIGRGAFESLAPQYVTSPSFAEPATRDDRRAALNELRDAIQAGIAARGEAPGAREAIEWVSLEQWHVPGSPGAEFQFARSEGGSGFTLSEPFQIDGEQLVLRSGVIR